MEATVTAVSWRQGHRQRLLQRLTRRPRVSRETPAGMQFFDVPGEQLRMQETIHQVGLRLSPFKRPGQRTVDFRRYRDRHILHLQL